MEPTSNVSAWTDWKKTTFGSWIDIPAYLRLRRAIIKTPDLIMSAAANFGKGPFAFALQSVVLVSCLSALINWGVASFANLPPEPIDRQIEAAKRNEKRLHPLNQNIAEPATSHSQNEYSRSSIDLGKQKRTIQFLQSVLPILGGLSILANALLFKTFLSSKRRDFPAVSNADRVYLYYVTARLFVPTSAVAILSNLALICFRFSSLDYTTAGFLMWLIYYPFSIWSLVLLSRAARPISNLFNFPERKKGGFNGRTFVANRLAGSQILTASAFLVLTFGVAYVYRLVLA